MAHCKHWKNGHCKDCRKNCPIKKKLMRAAARQAAEAPAPCPEPALEWTTPPPALAQALTHGEHVAHLAAALYAGLEPLHRLDASWAAVLDMAARLHDVGWVYGQKGHHKTSARMIRTNTLPLAPSPTLAATLAPALSNDAQPAKSCAGASEGDNAENATRRALAALVARYHRRTDPSPRQRRFAALPGLQKRGVRRLAALLRLADALDYSHARCVRHLEVALEEEAVRLVLECADHCGEEMARVETKKALFKKVFKKDVLCQFKKQEVPAMAGTAVEEKQAEENAAAREPQVKPAHVKTQAAKPATRQTPKQGAKQPPRQTAKTQPGKELAEQAEQAEQAKQAERGQQAKLARKTRTTKTSTNPTPQEAMPQTTEK